MKLPASVNRRLEKIDRLYRQIRSLQEQVNELHKENRDEIPWTHQGRGLLEERIPGAPIRMSAHKLAGVKVLMEQVGDDRMMVHWEHGDIRCNPSEMSQSDFHRCFEPINTESR